MKKLKIRINLFFINLLFLTFMVGAGSYILLYKFYFENYKQNIENWLLQKGKTTVIVLRDTIDRLVSSQDDITLMNELNKLAKDSDISYARVLNSSGTIVSHNNVNELGKTYKGKLTQLIVSSKSLRVTRRVAPSGWDVSVPLNNGLFFSIGISDVKLNALSAEKYDEIKQIFTITLVFTLLLSSIFTWFFIIKPLGHFRKYVDSVSWGKLDERLPLKGSSELVKISKAINELLDRVSNELRKIKKQSSLGNVNLLEIIHKICMASGVPFICVNTNGKIVLHSQVGIPIFEDMSKLDGAIIVEIVDDENFIQILRESRKTGLKKIESIYKGAKCIFITIPDQQNNPAETIIIFEK